MLCSGTCKELWVSLFANIVQECVCGDRGKVGMSHEDLCMPH